MDMRTVLEKISALSSPTIGMAGGSHAPVEEEMSRCAACGEKTHVDASTGFCIDCLDQMAKDQGKQDHRAFTDAPEENVNEDRMCETCSKPMEDCECEEMEEARNPYAVGMAQAMKQTGDEPPLEKSTIKKAHEIAKGIEQGKEEMEEGATCPKCGKSNCTCGKAPDVNSDKSANIDEDVYESELADLRKLAECEPMMAVATAPKPMDKMNVTTNMDSATGDQTVTVSAEGDSAEELMRILQMAGIAVTPKVDSSIEMAEDLANEPAPNALDTATVMNQGEDLNRAKGQYNGDRARDNSMSVVDEAVDQLAEKLRSRFINESAGNKTFKVMVKYDDPSGKGVASKTFNIKSVRDAKHAKDVVELKHMKNLKNPKIMRATEVEDL